MNESLDFFDEASRVGARILEVLGGKRASKKVKEYLERVAEIYKLLIDIHHEIAKVAARTSLAANMNEARKALKGIEYVSLENTFRAKHWCNELGELGQALRPLTQDVGLEEDDQRIWDEFCSKLEQREGEVAFLYDRSLIDFRNLAYRNLPLKTLKKKAEEIAEKLTIQKARFDLLAIKAEAMRERLG